MDDASLDDFLDDDSTASDEADAVTGDEEDGPSATGDEEVTGDVEDETPAAEANDAADQDHGESDVLDQKRGESDASDVQSDGTETGNEDGAVAPARSTMTFSPDPGECAACGEPVSRRWTDGDDLVCRECKEW